MDWILDHLQIIIAIAGAIAYWLNARKKEQAGEPADYDGDGKPDVHPQGGVRSMREHADTMDQAENIRRIQDEIRRKIAERQAGAGRMPPPLSPTPPHFPIPKVAEEARRAEVEREAAVVLERQQALAGQLAALQARRAEAGREAKAMWTQQPEPAQVTASRDDDVGLLRELRNARSLRKAIVLREVLGTPVGLR